ncbi:hypothetical protein ABMA27_007640 [Loxostege sticticalis]|uniref:DUF7041 domain-containing protein n=1 Tax=Loxostege sticticalis TaxID=481309 RepID=A0ABR3HG68_LOXSC
MTEEAKQDVMLISVSSRIPDFWTDQPALWFIQFEAVVLPQKASDDSCYQLLIAKLSKQVIQEVADLLASPPATGKYLALKKRLTDAYEESETRRIQKLISEMQLGEQKPSQLLRRMQNLAGKRMSEETLLVLWQNHLPQAVRTVLAATALEDVEKLASVADKVMETTKPIEIASVSQQPDSLAEVIANLTIEVAELRKSRQFTRGNNRSSQPSRTRSTSRRGKPSTGKDKNLCYYHHRFGKKAKKCREPCAWNERTKENMGN